MSTYSKIWRSMEEVVILNGSWNRRYSCSVCIDRYTLIQLLYSVHRPLQFNTAIVQCA